MELAAVSSAELQDQFLTLLVTQLQNQDPIEPVKQENFIAQLAQFSTVEGIEKLNVPRSEVPGSDACNFEGTDGVFKTLST